MISKFLTLQNDLNKPKKMRKIKSKQNKNMETVNKKTNDESKDNNNITKEVLNTDIKHTQSDITKNQEVTLAQLLSSETDLEKNTIIDCKVTPDSDGTLKEKTNSKHKDLAFNENTNTIDWANLYDEQPDLAEEDPKIIIDNLLSKSKADIEHLRKYILSQDIKPIDKKDIKVENMQQYFIDGELAYPLDRKSVV